MHHKTKMFLLAAVVATALAGVFTSVQFASAGGQSTNQMATTASPPIPLKEAKLIIEHNAKDNDTGFQGFLDSEGWKEITVTGPNGQVVLEFEAEGKLGQLGMTELFFETVEPENAEVPISKLLKTLPAGKYKFEGTAIENGELQGKTVGTAVLSHKIPRGPQLLTPAEDKVVSPNKDLFVSWKPVNKALDGSSVKIIAYQLIIERDEDPDPHMIGKIGLSMYLPPSVTKITIPDEFLEPGTDYLWEVLAIEESGNQTLVSSQFSTSG
jgi:hypothetical protein